MSYPHFTKTKCETLEEILIHKYSHRDVPFIDKEKQIEFLKEK